SVLKTQLEAIALERFEERRAEQDSFRFEREEFRRPLQRFQDRAGDRASLRRPRVRLKRKVIEQRIEVPAAHEAGVAVNASDRTDRPGGGEPFLVATARLLRHESETDDEFRGDFHSASPSNEETGLGLLSTQSVQACAGLLGRQARRFAAAPITETISGF